MIVCNRCGNESMDEEFQMCLMCRADFYRVQKMKPRSQVSKDVATYNTPIAVEDAPAGPFKIVEHESKTEGRKYPGRTKIYNEYDAINLLIKQINKDIFFIDRDDLEYDIAVKSAKEITSSYDELDILYENRLVYDHYRADDGQIKNTDYYGIDKFIPSEQVLKGFKEAYISEKNQYLNPETSSVGTCGYCKGTGIGKCQCNNGKERCTHCYEGRVDCTCGGVLEKCRICEGTGKVLTDDDDYTLALYKKCTECEGKGLVSYCQCGGKGYNRCSYCKGTGLMKCTVCKGKKKSTCYICKGDKISIHTVAMEQEYIPLTIRSMRNEKIVDRKIYKKKDFSPYAPSGYDYYVNETMLSESQVLSNPAFKKQYKDFNKSIKNRKLEGVGQFVAYSLKECRHSYYDINYLVNNREYNALVEMSSRTIIMDKNPVVDFMNDNLGLLDEYLEQHNYKGYVTKHNQCIKIARTNGGKLKKPSSEAYRKVQKMISNIALIPAFILVAFLYYKFPAEFKQMWVLLSATLSVVLTSTFLGKEWESFLGVVGDGKLAVAIIFWSLFIELFVFGSLFLILGYLMTGALPI